MVKDKKDRNPSTSAQDVAGAPEESKEICPKCGNVLVEEDKELMCPHCQGEIDFLGEGEE